MTTCKLCEKDFIPEKHNPHAIFCSRKCKQNYYIRTGGKDLYHRRREEAMEILGGKCVLCGTNDSFLLTIDHIHDDPENDPFRRGISRRRTNNMLALLRWVINNPALAKLRFQILCYNCNNLKKNYREEYEKRQGLNSR